MRKYKKIVLHTNNSIMFRMENGWNYLVDIRYKKIYPIDLAGSYMSHQPYFTMGAPDDKELLKKAEELLQKLPVELAWYRGKTYENEKDFPYNEEEIDD